MLQRRLWVVGLVLCGILMALAFLFAQSFRAEQKKQIAYLESQSQLQTLTALLVKELGYTGMIHHFKNYVIRADEQYYVAAKHSIDRVERFLFEFRQLNKVPHLELEYQQIADVVAAYKAKLEMVRQLIAAGFVTADIDKQVRVDDTRASLAQRTIISYQQAELNKSLQSLQAYHQRVLLNLVGLVVSAALFSTVVSILLYKYFHSSRRSSDVITSLNEKQRLLDASPNPVLVVSELGEVVFASDGAAELFEVPKSELLSSKLEQWIPMPFRTGHEQMRQMFFATRGARTMVNPVTLVTRSGKSREIEVCIGLYEVDGVRYAVANIVDVSNSAQIRKKLELAERKFRTTFELAPIGIVHLDMNFRLLEVNACFAQMLGYGVNEMLEKTLLELSDPGNVDLAQEAKNRLLEGDIESYKMDRRYLHRDGRSIWCNVVITLSRDGTGVPQYMIAVVEDITQRKYFEQHLMASEKKFKTIAQYVNGVVWMFSPGMTRTLYVNEAYERIWQHSRESLYSHPRSFIAAVVVEDRERVLAELKNHEQGHWKIRYRIERPDGTTRHIEDEGAAVRDEEGNILYLVGLARDVTDEQIFRERLETTNQQLERLAKFDPLTMALRRQYSTPDLEESIALYRRYQTDATLIFIDMDNFKDVNDRYGHEVGDEVLMEFARVVRSFIRETDAFYRYAGDEFLVLLRETSQEEADAVVNKMLRKLPSVQVGLGQVVSIQFSSGVASLARNELDNARDWVRIADAKMYEAKRSRQILAVKN